jgi:hypothetical protein
MRTHTDEERIQRDSDRASQRIKSIIESCVVAVVTEAGCSYNEASATVLAEVSRNLTPGAVKAALAKAK